MVGALALCRFAELAPLLFLVGASLHVALFAPADLARDLSARLWRPTVAAALLAALAALAWLALEAAAMGQDWAGTLNFAAWRDVLTGTAFGALWLVRLVVLALLIAALPAARRGRWAPVLAAGAAALASLAFTGHAVMQEGLRGLLHRGNDAVHLLAAGAWIGGLVGFALDLSRFDDPTLDASAKRAAWRFSAWAHGFVALVVVTGAVNAALILQNRPDFVVSPYRTLLLAKIVLVGAMIATALVNRYVLVPRLTEGDGRALGALKRNCLGEGLLSVVVVALVSVFGLLEPT